MSVVIFERPCPKCLSGILVYRSNSEHALRYKCVEQFNFFICDTCPYKDDIEMEGIQKADELHREAD